MLATRLKAASGGIDVSYQGVWTSTSDLTTYTSTAFSTGSSTGNKLLIMAITSYAGTGNFRPVSSVSVNGNAATIVQKNTTGSANSTLAYYGFSGSGTATIAVTHSGSNQNCAISLYVVTGLPSNRYAEYNSDRGATTGTTTQTLKVSIPQGGFVITAVMSETNSSTMTLTLDSAFTQDYSAVLESRSRIHGSLLNQPAAVDRSFTYSGTGSGSPKSACIASWGLSEPLPPPP